MESLMCWRQRRQTRSDEVKHLAYCEQIDTNLEHCNFEMLNERIDEVVEMQRM